MFWGLSGPLQLVGVGAETESAGPWAATLLQNSPLPAGCANISSPLAVHFFRDVSLGDPNSSESLYLPQTAQTSLFLLWQDQASNCISPPPSTAFPARLPRPPTCPTPSPTQDKVTPAQAWPMESASSLASLLLFSHHLRPSGDLP